MYGATTEGPQTENTPLRPQKPYGAAKVFAHSMVNGYRKDHRVFAVSGILYNHESPRRGEHFVTRKITTSLAKIKLGIVESFAIGNLDAKRDWGFAGDYVKAMWLMLQQQEPDDYVIATCESHSVTELVETAFSCVDLDWKEYMSIDRRLYRPAEIYELRGDPAKARNKLDWQPSVRFEHLIQMMVNSEIESLTHSSR